MRFFRQSSSDDHTRTNRWSSACFVAVFSATASLSHASPSYQEILIDSLGSFTPKALSGDGSTAMVRVNNRVYFWSKDEGELGSAPARVGEGDLSFDGTEAAYVFTRDLNRWNEDGTTSPVVDPLTGLTAGTTHPIISGDGTRIVSSGDLDATIIGPDGDFEIIPASQIGYNSSARGGSADLSTVVGTSWVGAFPSNVTSVGWAWRKGTPMLEVLDYQPTGISADGLTIIGRLTGDDGTPNAIRQTQDGTIEIIGAGDDGSWLRPDDVSADGSTIVGDRFLDSRILGGVVWTEAKGARHIDEILADLGLIPDDDLIRTVRQVSDDGMTFLGGFATPSGDLMAGSWIATIPEPSSAVLISVGLAFLATARTRPNA